jgi:hypothetical protein
MEVSYMTTEDAFDHVEPGAQRCGKCRFWKGLEKRNGYGICRANPPRAEFLKGEPEKGLPGYDIKAVPASPNSTITIWPDTHENDWCGAFRSKYVSHEFTTRSSGILSNKESIALL